MAITSGTVTLERQHITIGAACAVLLIVAKLSFGYGHETGADKSTYDIQFQNINLGLMEIKSSIKESEVDRKAYQNNINVQLGEFSGKLLVMQQRLDDLSIQVSNNKPHGTH